MGLGMGSYEMAKAYEEAAQFAKHVSATTKQPVKLSRYISNYEQQYMETLIKILSEGDHMINERTKIGTYRIPNVTLHLGPDDGIPLMITKKVMWKSAIKEILWIMQKASNNIHDLDAHIWDEWADEDGSIGKAYGYQIKQFEQVNNLLHTLETDPSSRRGVIDLWQIKDIPEMNLTPCCYSSIWNISDGKLNGTLIQRSGDFFLGVVFNTIQYRALQYMFAHHLGVGVGDFLHVISDAHVYDNQLDQANEQIKRYSLIRHINLFSSYTDIDSTSEKSETEFFMKQYLRKINPDMKFDSDTNLIQYFYNYPANIVFGSMDGTKFWDMSIDNFRVTDYFPFPAIKAPVAV